MSILHCRDIVFTLHCGDIVSILYCEDTVHPALWRHRVHPALWGHPVQPAPVARGSCGCAGCLGHADGHGGDVLLVAPATLPRMSGGMSCSMPQGVALQQSPEGTSLPAIQVVPDMVNVQTDMATVEWADLSFPHVPAWRRKLTHPEAARPLLGGLWSSGWWKRGH